MGRSDGSVKIFVHRCMGYIKLSQSYSVYLSATLQRNPFCNVKAHCLYRKWQVFRFLKGQIPRFFAILIFTVFFVCTQSFLKNTMSENAEISRVGLPISY